MQKPYDKRIKLMLMPATPDRDSVHPLRYATVYDVAWDREQHRLDLMVVRGTRRKPDEGRAKQITVGITGTLTADLLGDMLIVMANRLKKLHRTGK